MNFGRYYPFESPFSSFATGVPLKKVELLFELRVEIGK